MERLIKEEATKPPEQNPFKGDKVSSDVWELLTDEALKETIQMEVPQCVARTKNTFEEMEDKVEIEDMLRRTVGEEETVYDIPPLHVTKIVKKVPEVGEEWERFNVLVYQTDKHLFIFNATMSTANRIQRVPILGALELARYEVRPLPPRPPAARPPP